MRTDLENLDRKTVHTDEFPFKYCVYYLGEDQMLFSDTMKKAVDEVYEIYEGKYTKTAIRKRFQSCDYAINENNKY